MTNTKEWTDKDEKELIVYEKTLKESERVNKHASWIVFGVYAIIITGIITLAVLMV